MSEGGDGCVGAEAEEEEDDASPPPSLHPSSSSSSLPPSSCSSTHTVWSAFLREARAWWVCVYPICGECVCGAVLSPGGEWRQMMGSEEREKRDYEERVAMNEEEQLGGVEK